jgi:hypothetical protein
MTTQTKTYGRVEMMRAMQFPIRARNKTPVQVKPARTKMLVDKLE